MPSPARIRSLVSVLGPILLAAALSAPPAVAADSASAPISVHRLLSAPAELASRLTQANPDVAAARARISEAHAESGQSRLVPNPVLDASLEAIPISSRVQSPTFSNNALWTVGLSETVELGKRGPRAAAADLREQASRVYYTGTLAERMGAARSAMASALHLFLRTGTLEESLHDAERATELQRVRYEQKALSGTDYDRMLLELSGLQAEVSANRAEYESALGTCAALLGARCDLRGAEERDLDAALPLGEVGLTPKRLSERPDLRGLELEGEAARHEAELARRRAIPDVTLRVAYSHDNQAGAGEALDSLTVGVMLPLPLADHGQHDAARALARASELASQRASLVNLAEADASGLLRRKIALEQTLGALTSESLPRARNVLESTQQAFDHGGISLTDFLLARRSYVGLQLSLLELRFQLFAIRNELYRVLGLDAQPQK
jgi:cobalt-zinc-cadmium efflux system outer membrane protein